MGNKKKNRKAAKKSHNKKASKKCQKVQSVTKLPVEDGNGSGCDAHVIAVNFKSIQKQISHVCKKYTDMKDKGYELCLTCCHVGSGENVEKSSEDQCTSVKHFENSRQKHHFAYSIDKQETWCYTCKKSVDTYETSSSLTETIALIHQHLLFLQKMKCTSKDTSTSETMTSVSAYKSDRRVHSEDLPFPMKCEPSDGIKGRKSIIGLLNLGNTCFFNAMIQNLCWSRLLQEYFTKTREDRVDCVDGFWFTTDNKPSEENNYENTVDGKSKMSDLVPVYVSLDRYPSPIITALQALLSDMRGTTSGTANPKRLFLELVKIAPHFEGYQQQDSHEALRFLMDGWRSAENERRLECVPEKHLNSNGKQKKLRAEQLGSFVDVIYGGNTCNTIRCHNCHNSSTTVEKFFDLSLPMPKTSCVDIAAKHGQGEKDVQESMKLCLSKRQKKAAAKNIRNSNRGKGSKTLHKAQSTPHNVTFITGNSILGAGVNEYENLIDNMAVGQGESEGTHTSLNEKSTVRRKVYSSNGDAVQNKVKNRMVAEAVNYDEGVDVGLDTASSSQSDSPSTYYTVSFKKESRVTCECEGMHATECICRSTHAAEVAGEVGYTATIEANGEGSSIQSMDCVDGFPKQSDCVAYNSADNEGKEKTHIHPTTSAYISGCSIPSQSSADVGGECMNKSVCKEEVNDVSPLPKPSLEEDHCKVNKDDNIKTGYSVSVDTSLVKEIESHGISPNKCTEEKRRNNYQDDGVYLDEKESDDDTDLFNPLLTRRLDGSADGDEETPQSMARTSRKSPNARESFNLSGFKREGLTLEDCLKALCSPEELVGGNKYLCDFCKTLCDATKWLLVDQVPSILTIHLKRFEVKGMRMKKLMTHVDFPLDFDLAPFCNRSCTYPDGKPIPADKPIHYRLSGIVVHDGSSLGGGHYTACLRHYNHNEQESTWSYVSDTTQSTMPQRKVLNKQASLLFYELVL
eukprot:CFRG0206T1